ncbi:hypothetical protein BCR32DRAFT_289235 [Anaeromyces robustus]|uniref:Transcription factor domain-containing protein n=1 Tax=Anaeromyces robustus TaxID=1754192 RepID=A0A1Y1XPA7_9FUNG|nr:hypothetical protein BCR32DRAFT_289235 [Anaeromyces robustus]|eukprot:ORX87583.1 hypothetical protein BCR32DRAFT_289235 [Anaeromyces robustus]
MEKTFQNITDSNNLIDSINNKKRNINNLYDDSSNNYQEEPITVEKKVKKGPKVGFINDKVNAEVVKILTKSNIQCEIKNEEIVVDNKKETNSNSNDITFNTINVNNKNNNKNNNGDADLEYDSDFNFDFDSDDNLNSDNKLLKNKYENNILDSTIINVKFINKKMTSGSATDIINNISTLYLKYLKKEEINHEYLNNLHEIFSLRNFDNEKEWNPLKTVNTEDYKKIKNVMIEYTPGSKKDLLHINFNLITDFFKYAYNITPIIYPSVILLRIQQKSLSPGLLFAIYSGAYLFRPNQNKIKSRFYYVMSVRSLLGNIQKYDIQNLQTAFILSNILPGLYLNYMLSGITLRLVKVLNLNDDCKQDKNNLFYYERVNSIWLSISIDTLLNFTCNNLEHIIWLDQPLPQSVTDRMLMEKYPPSEYSIKFIVITNYIAKVINHAKNRREGIFNNKEFLNLMEEQESIRKHLKKDFNNFQESKFKNNNVNGYQLYIYLIFFTAKLILFNMELSPFVYQKRLFPSNKYIKIRKTPMKNNINTNKNLNINHNNDILINENLNIPINKNEIKTTNSSHHSEKEFNAEYFNSKYRYFSILENIPCTCFNYKRYDEIDIVDNVYNDDNDDNNVDSLFLNIPPLVNDIDYESCYNVCYDTVELSKNVLFEINEQMDPSRIIYPCYLCFAFYNIGLFYMLVYANFKEEKVKKDIEYFHDQIKNVYHYYPHVSVYFSKMYEYAKMDAYEAFSNNSILFCPKGSF